MDYSDIQELIKSFDQSNFALLEIITNDIKIKMKNNTKKEKKIRPTLINNEKKIKNELNQTMDEIASTTEVLEEDDKLTTIKSSIVGLFCRSAVDGGEPLVEIGTSVIPGQLLTVIKMLNIENHIISEVYGKVVEICVEDRSIVDYGMKLIVIKHTK
ncbi:hypothetical protein KPL35_17430 [Clostridium sp. CF011]|uniref:acetyl-CoA carboxylase biotin carboxyl carrier protein n=1 Tax=Clostridium sp. CF011 TaxID=2843318 RepID=UPI001C0D4570|nr:biotin/lipoyl-containing protein [Clostridium sp. CF011]MBU3093816.1 hypothetical protein [Clostridium sp. CF011]WAG71754.1 hypothetical protein LL036_18460 [Clostridium sp. CF011]